jgi:hypothetical protein
MTEYLKSKFLSEPVVYVQDDTEWRSYPPGGGVTQSAGRIPASMLAGLEPMGAFEAERLIERRLAGAAEAQRQARQAERKSSSSRTVDLVLRYLGIVLPAAASVAWAASFGFVFDSEVSRWLPMVVSLTVWLAFSVALLVRKDGRGALAITVLYVFLNWWVFLIALVPTALD